VALKKEKYKGNGSREKKGKLGRLWTVKREEACCSNFIGKNGRGSRESGNGW